jgi:hypothetical protein
VSVRDYPVEEFLWGLGAGLVAVAVAVGAAAVAGRTRSGAHPAPATGLLMGIAALLAMSPSRAPTAGLLLGLAGVTAAASLAAGRRSAPGVAPLLTAVLLASPFAWLLAIDASSVGWVRAVVVAGATLAPVAVARTDTEWASTGLTPVLYTVTAAGVFAAVPNTRDAAALLGASVPGALAGWPSGCANLGRAGAAGTSALLVWVAAAGSLGREPALVGALACLGLLATLPAGRWLAGRWIDRRPRARLRVVAAPLSVLVVHAVVVSVASRVAGVSHELRIAVPVAVAAMVSAVMASAWLRADAVSTASDQLLRTNSRSD